jgi:ribosomal protein S19
LAKIEKVNMEEREIIVMWSRASSILPAMVGHTIAIHNGKEHMHIYMPPEPTTLEFMLEDSNAFRFLGSARRV